MFASQAVIHELGFADLLTTLKLSKSFVYKMFKAMRLSHRKPTQAARKLPADWRDQQDTFAYRCALLAAKYKIPPELVVNIDQSSFEFIPSRGGTYAATGSKDVKCVGLGDKRNITILPGISAAGGVLPLQLIFEGKFTPEPT